MTALPGLTAMQTFHVASLAGALLFFVAGALCVALRRNRHLGEAARMRSALADAETLAREQAATASRLRTDLERRVSELDRAFSNAQARTDDAEREMTKLQARLDEAEQQLAARNAIARDALAETDLLKRRLADAEALRSEYVRLRTTVSESEYLKSEVARLENELREVKVAALTGPVAIQTRRHPRGSTGMPKAPRSISESLAWAIDRFADQSTRGSAIADTLGFPLASTGDDGLALAAYGALVMETANRAKQFLPLASPASIEIVDERGARVSVWTFAVENDPLLLVNLAVAPVDHRKVEATLADLTTILAPTSIARGA